ncbi:hypothetical protein DL95DRAFT_443125 [Leptodontidium sp. 2 PMI_412]|nr:hypothetical protein DL95DRAFT_443125 [Leptodontidium sp. 2 PMI_412]
MRTPTLLSVLALANAATVLGSSLPPTSPVDGLQRRSNSARQGKPTTCVDDKDCRHNPSHKDWNKPRCEESMCVDYCKMDSQCQGWASDHNLKICPPNYPPTPEQVEETGKRCAFCSTGPLYVGSCVSALTK